MNTTGSTCGSKKLIAMSRKKEPPLLNCSGFANHNNKKEVHPNG
jgi:hypothetical protein